MVGAKGRSSGDDVGDRWSGDDVDDRWTGDDGGDSWSDYDGSPSTDGGVHRGTGRDTNGLKVLV